MRLVLLAILLISVFPAPAEAFGLSDVFDFLGRFVPGNCISDGLTVLGVTCEIGYDVSNQPIWGVKGSETGSPKWITAQSAHLKLEEVNTQLAVISLPFENERTEFTARIPKYQERYYTGDFKNAIDKMVSVWTSTNTAKVQCRPDTADPKNCHDRTYRGEDMFWGTMYDYDYTACKEITDKADKCGDALKSHLTLLNDAQTDLEKALELDGLNITIRDGLLLEYEKINPRPSSVKIKIDALNNRIESHVKGDMGANDQDWQDSTDAVDKYTKTLYMLKNAELSGSKINKMMQFLVLTSELANKDDGTMFNVLGLHTEAMSAIEEMDELLTEYYLSVDAGFHKGHSQISSLKAMNGHLIDQSMVRTIEQEALNLLTEDELVTYPLGGSNPKEMYTEARIYLGDCGSVERFLFEESANLFSPSITPYSPNSFMSKSNYRARASLMPDAGREWLVEKYGTVGYATVFAEQTERETTNALNLLDKAVTQTENLLIISDLVQQTKLSDLDAKIELGDASPYAIQQARTLVRRARDTVIEGDAYEVISGRVSVIEDLRLADDWLSKPLDEVVEGSLVLGSDLEKECQETIEGLDADGFDLSRFTEEIDLFHAAKERLAECTKDLCAHEIYPDFIAVLDGRMMPPIRGIYSMTLLSYPYTEMFAENREIKDYLEAYNAVLSDGELYEEFKTWESTFEIIQAKYPGLEPKDVLGEIRRIRGDYNSLLVFLKANYGTIEREFLGMITSGNAWLRPNGKIVIDEPVEFEYIINIENTKNFKIDLSEPLEVTLPIEGIEEITLNKVSQDGNKVKSVSADGEKLTIGLASIGANEHYPISIQNSAILVKSIGGLETRVEQTSDGINVVQVQELESLTSLPYTIKIAPTYCPAGKRQGCFYQETCRRLDEVEVLKIEPCTFETLVEGEGEYTFSVTLEVPQAIKQERSGNEVVLEDGKVKVDTEIEVTNELDIPVEDIQVEEELGQYVKEDTIRIEVDGQEVEHEFVDGKVIFKVSLGAHERKTYRIEYETSDPNEYAIELYREIGRRLDIVKRQIKNDGELFDRYNKTLAAYGVASQQISENDIENAVSLLLDVDKSLDSLEFDVASLVLLDEELKRTEADKKKLQDQVEDDPASAREAREYGRNAEKGIHDAEQALARLFKLGVDIDSEAISLAEAGKKYAEGLRFTASGQDKEAAAAFKEAKEEVDLLIARLEQSIPGTLSEELEKLEARKLEGDIALEGIEANLTVLEKAVRLKIAEEKIKYLLKQHQIEFSVPDLNLTAEFELINSLKSLSTQLDKKITEVKSVDSDGLLLLLSAEEGKDNLVESVEKYASTALSLRVDTSARVKAYESTASGSIESLSELVEYVNANRQKISKGLNPVQNRELDALLAEIGKSIEESNDHVSNGEFMTAYAVAAFPTAKISELLQTIEGTESSNAWMLVPLLIIFAFVGLRIYKQKPEKSRIKHVGRPVDRVLKEAKREAHVKREIEEKEEKKKKVLKRGYDE